MYPATRGMGFPYHAVVAEGGEDEQGFLQALGLLQAVVHQSAGLEIRHLDISGVAQC